ncbi:hypothetical protein [Streptomyces sp. G1]|uniref:hypothetical protein n=1 Tax=Streptomyces sp. G1 TaxID=361572 RepID=UPI00202DE105|nr:hypothetical protein [Streptomyces sp. G1]MCM1964851.1 hypothetical protein [Streptomyces sp. G1]
MAASKAQRAATAERRRKAISMVLAGVDWDTIAERLGYASRGAAHTDVTRALEANLRDVAGEAAVLREVQGLRYERLLAALWGKALKGDPKHVEGAAKIVDRVVKLYGLAEPDKLKLDATGTVTAEDLMAMIRSAPADADR